MEQQNKPLGAVWVKKSKEGKTFLTGVIHTGSGDVDIVAFKNPKKEENPKQPDYYMWKSEPREEQKPKLDNLEPEL